jgi:hypothetical protein
MPDQNNKITRRDFIKGASCAALGVAMGVNAYPDEVAEVAKKTSVVLIRHKDVILPNGKLDAKIAKYMVDQAVSTLTGLENPAEAWKTLIKPNDIVGIKSNEWGPLPTPPEIEQALKNGCISTGVSEKNIGISDRSVLSMDVFKKATALINVRPFRTHHWSGVGSLIKNPIMFVPEPWLYHDNSCADLAKLWELPIIKGKTRLNILVMMTPLFHGIGPHHFDKTFTWAYNGLLAGFDPVAVDAVGLRILKAKRLEYFKEEIPMKPSPHHIALADTKHHLGVADMNKINLIKLGWDEGILI